LAWRLHRMLSRMLRQNRAFAGRGKRLVGAAATVADRWFGS
jgi:hypothetical protein